MCKEQQRKSKMSWNSTVCVCVCTLVWFGRIALFYVDTPAVQQHVGIYVHRQLWHWNTFKQHVRVPDWFGPAGQTGWWETALKPLSPTLCSTVRTEEPRSCHSTVNPRHTLGQADKNRQREQVHRRNLRRGITVIQRMPIALPYRSVGAPKPLKRDSSWLKYLGAQNC